MNQEADGLQPDVSGRPLSINEFYGLPGIGKRRRDLGRLGGCQAATVRIERPSRTPDNTDTAAKAPASITRPESRSRTRIAVSIATSLRARMYVSGSRRWHRPLGSQVTTSIRQCTGLPRLEEMGSE